MESHILGAHASIDNLSVFLKQLASLSAQNGTIIQAMDAAKIAGEAHVLFAVEKALRAKECNCNAAKDIGVEIMRYASGKRQIEGAFSMGVHEGDMDVVLVVLGDRDGIKNSVAAIKNIVRESPVVAYSVSKKDPILAQFNITEGELGAVGEEMIPDLVMERVALVDILK
ncbi:KEOPS complex subunit Cgi121 [Methanolobus sp. ZRKC3]|uniref:KEOPS complex subunit Cgi121 n=1 Tax=Methanolobus sp. ZRKC3 TaxID=3125786 RepID=UPI00324EE588